MRAGGSNLAALICAAIADVQRTLAVRRQRATRAGELMPVEAEIDRFAAGHRECRRDRQIVRQVVISSRRELVSRRRIRLVQGLPLDIRRVASVRTRRVAADRVIGMDRGRRFAAARFALAHILRGGSCVLRFDHHVRRRSDRRVLRRDDHAAH